MDSSREYRLLFQGHEIARIKSNDSDFPTFAGTFALSQGVRENSNLARVNKYVMFSIRVFPLYENEGLTDEEYEEEASFQDLIDSKEWVLEDAAGNQHLILIPNFGPENVVTWRFIS